ncbi:protein-(glutamine-N5) methyltransferase, release factor-specific [Candidatus Saccharibacteria bacterium RIFCSPHIGHO2_01_FULL_45_15]|nr:MAG: protein-(glutamine-N5) methyltransferase, release factor-specific [Candidatus Saccharibacteria bacterium RIFCSPHIGHO2_01_FULL_45_15]OGL26818.1 MAG: protein-(glutamine-N5) methyltransferase, release factor-specific [Candidatus Saccharibacteria bacterium RIFCSPHIGHO2_02_FULL_46_12]OGL32040.1 MAG: protein-(glutamine-N5) methyltransferase, release factor-specific [Candidatus Saccharibacteria bacterium RIFCSPHIGHO2_12_FULL_44_22]
MPAINAWLIDATARLKGAGIQSARLDAELILSHTIKRPRTYLHAHGDELLDPRHREIADARIDMRLDFTPIAYIIGHKEFYGRPFKVTTATLIPRPESETMIEMLNASLGSNASLLPNTKRLVDVGTGTGCLGITAKLEHPELDITLIDISQHALNVAEKNAKALGATVTLHHGDLLRGYALPIDIILANLPYVDREWDVSPETRSEPDVALYASNHGLASIFVLISQADQLLTANGILYLEADPRQHHDIISYAKQYRLQHLQTNGFIVSFCKQ